MFSNLKSNGTNRKFIFFLKLKAKKIKKSKKQKKIYNGKNKTKMEKAIFIVKLITNLRFTKISKNSNFNYSNLKTNGTNRKFIIFLKLMALIESS